MEGRVFDETQYVGVVEATGGKDNLTGTRRRSCNVNPVLKWMFCSEFRAIEFFFLLSYLGSRRIRISVILSLFTSSAMSVSARCTARHSCAQCTFHFVTQHIPAQTFALLIQLRKHCLEAPNSRGRDLGPLISRDKALWENISEETFSRSPNRGVESNGSPSEYSLHDSCRAEARMKV